jgi:hypothetical protein
VGATRHSLCPLPSRKEIATDRDRTMSDKVPPRPRSRNTSSSKPSSSSGTSSRPPSSNRRLEPPEHSVRSAAFMRSWCLRPGNRTVGLHLSCCIRLSCQMLEGPPLTQESDASESVLPQVSDWLQGGSREQCCDVGAILRGSSIPLSRMGVV